MDSHGIVMDGYGDKRLMVWKHHESAMEEALTTLFDGTVVKLSLWVSGVAPGSVQVCIGVATEVLR